MAWDFTQYLPNKNILLILSVYPRYFLLLKNHSDLEEKQRCNTAGGSILKFMKPNTASKSKDNSINVSSINETSPMLEDMNITNNATVNLTVENQENEVQNVTENLVHALITILKIR